MQDYSWGYVTTGAEPKQPVGALFYQWVSCTEDVGLFCFPNSVSCYSLYVGPLKSLPLNYSYTCTIDILQPQHLYIYEHMTHICIYLPGEPCRERWFQFWMTEFGSFQCVHCQEQNRKRKINISTPSLFGNCCVSSKGANRTCRRHWATSSGTCRHTVGCWPGESGSVPVADTGWSGRWPAERCPEAARSVSSRAGRTPRTPVAWSAGPLWRWRARLLLLKSALHTETTLHDHIAKELWKVWGQLD